MKWQDQSWADNTAFGYCPICNGPVGEASHSQLRYYKRIIYCSNSIDKQPGKHIYAPWDAQPDGATEMTSGHFYQSFEQEIYVTTAMPDGQERRRWDMRKYRRGNSYYEVCYRSILSDTEDSKDTLIHCNQLQHVFPRVVLFDTSLDKIITKMNRLLNLI